MTRVYLEKDGDRYLVSVQGHAAGSDAVCAAASGIVYALAGYLANEREKVETEAVRLESGNACLRFRGGERAEAAYRMTMIGLLQIEKKAPEYIQVEAQGQARPTGWTGARAKNRRPRSGLF